MIVCGRDVRIRGRLLRIAHYEGDKYLFLDHPEEMIEGLRKTGRRIDLFTFMQRASEAAPKYRYPMEWDNLAVLPVSSFEHWWMETLGFKGRNKAKQAEKKGVKLREVPYDDALLQGICGIYNECPVRQGKPFAHYGMTLEQMRQYAGTFLEHSFFIGAFLGETMIGFVKLTMDETRTQAGLMHIVSMVQHRDKAPTNALIAHSVKACAERKIPNLVYSNFAYGGKLSDSLSDFKERNGFRRVDLPRYYVPLTDFGWAAFHMGLHHKITEHVPEPVLAKLREFRNHWYNRKFQALSEAS
jgi:hypothetical protein